MPSGLAISIIGVVIRHLMLYQPDAPATLVSSHVPKSIKSIAYESSIYMPL